MRPSAGTDRLWIAGILAGALLWLCWPGLSPDSVLFLRDHTFIFRRSLHAVVEALSTGQVAHWEPGAGGGEPLAAYPSALAWSPLLLLFLLPGDFHFLYDVFVLAHFPLGALGAYLLGRRLDLGVFAAGVTALMFVLAGAIVSLNDLLTGFEAVSFGPLAVYAGLRLARAPTPGNLVLFAVCLGFHGQVADPMFLLGTVAVFFVAWVPEERRSPRRAPRAFVALCAGTALAVLLVAVQLAPLIEQLRGSERGAGFDYRTIADFSLSPLRLMQIFLADSAGDPRENAWLFCEPSGPYLRSIYLGATAAPLLFLAAAVRGARRWLILGAVFLVLALGKHTPIHELLIDAFPPLSAARYPVKFACASALCFALACGTALDAFLAGSDAVRKNVARVALPGVGLVAALCLWLLAGPVEWIGPHLGQGLDLETGVAFVRGSAAYTIIAVSASAALLLAASRDRLRLDFAARGLAVLIALDLLFAARALMPVTSASMLEPPPIARVLLGERASPSVFLYGQFRFPSDLRRPDAAQVMAYGASRLTPGVGIPLGVRYLLDPDHNSTRSKPWAAVFREFGALDEPRRLALLGRLGVEFMLVEANTRDIPGLEFVGEGATLGGPPIAAFRIEDHRPRLSLRERALVTRDLQASVRALTSTGAIGRAIVEAEDLFRLPPDLRSALSSTTSAVEISAAVEDAVFERGRVRVRVTSPGPALLILAQTYADGWTATVGGEPVAPIRADALLTGVPIRGGTHEVELRYVAPNFAAGAYVSVAAWALALVLAVGSALARRRRA